MEMAVWSTRINGNLKSHSVCPSALGIRLTHSVDREQNCQYYGELHNLTMQGLTGLSCLHL